MYWIVLFSVLVYSCANADEPTVCGKEPPLSVVRIFETDCELPSYPDRGSYVVIDKENAKPGDRLNNFSLIQYNMNGDGILEIRYINCSYGGKWTYEKLECISCQSTQTQSETSSDVKEPSSELPLKLPVNENESTVKVSVNKGPIQIPVNENESTVKVTVNESPIQIPVNENESTVKVSANKSPIQIPVNENESTVKVSANKSTIQIPVNENESTVKVTVNKSPIQIPVNENESTVKVTVNESSIKIPIDESPVKVTVNENPIKILVNEETSTENPVISVVVDTILKHQMKPCILPPYPEFGSYKLISESNNEGRPGDAFDSVRLNFTCDPGYHIMGNDNVFCLNGKWSDDLPQCKRYCRLDRQQGVEYQCRVEGTEDGIRACGEFEPEGSVIKTYCKAPFYYSNFFYYNPSVQDMNCTNGTWDNTVTCNPVCGLEYTILGSDLSGGRRAERRELPWHVAVYSKLSDPFMQVCSGSIISYNLVVTAAHCFWSDIENLQSPTCFAVAAGKLYRPWNDPQDDNVQRSDISDIKIPPRFRGVQTNFQDDIALVFLTTPFVFNADVWPICINFNAGLDRLQLRNGRFGKVAGWGLTGENEGPSQVLKVVELPYVEIDQCIANASPDFRQYITSDKICAGFANGTAVCRGDSGGGLAFSEADPEDVQKRYHFLRGVVSTAPTNDDLCNTFAITSFTQILAHEHFIKEHFNGNLL